MNFSISFWDWEKPFRKYKFDLRTFGSILFALGYLLCIIFPKQFFFFGKYKTPFYNGIFQYGNKISPWENKYYEFKPNLYLNNCEEQTELLKKISNSECEIINPSATKNIFLIGDSHVENHVKSILSATRTKQLSDEYKSITKLKGDILAKQTKDKWQNFKNKKSADKFEELLKGLYLNLNIGDLIIFSIERDDLIKKSSKVKNLPRETDYYLLSLLELQLNRLIELVQFKNAYLLLVDDIPKPCKNSDYYLINVVKKGDFSFCKVTKEESLKDRNPKSLIYKKLSLEKKVLYVDFHNELCPNDICGVTAPNSKNDLLYRDSSPHFYKKNSAILSDSWYQILIKIKNNFINNHY